MFVVYFGLPKSRKSFLFASPEAFLPLIVFHNA